MRALDKVRIDCSSLTGQIRLARTGKDPDLALETRECKSEVMAAVIRHMMFDSPTGIEETGTVDGRSYIIRVTPAEPQP